MSLSAKATTKTNAIATALGLSVDTEVAEEYRPRWAGTATADEVKAACTASGVDGDAQFSHIALPKYLTFTVMTAPTEQLFVSWDASLNTVIMRVFAVDPTIVMGKKR